MRHKNDATRQVKGSAYEARGALHWYRFGSRLWKRWIIRNRSPI